MIGMDGFPYSQTVFTSGSPGMLPLKACAVGAEHFLLLMKIAYSHLALA